MIGVYTVPLILVAGVTSILYFLSIFKFNYWKKKKVPYIEPVPLFGNYANLILLRKLSGVVAQELCKKFPNEPYFGTFYGTEPALIVQDPDYVKMVMTKDFYFFSGREISNYTDKEVLTKNIFFSGGDTWKVMRQNMTPLFSSAKMKKMFYLIEDCSFAFEKMLDEEFKKSNYVEVRALMAKYTMGCIGSCAFGIDTKTMEEAKPGENNFFRNLGNLIFANSTYRGIKNVARAMWPAAFYGLGLKSFPEEIDRYFHNLLVGIFQGREYRPSNRNDFVDLVLTFKEKNYLTGDSLSSLKSGDSTTIEIKVDDKLLVAQCLVMFAAGFETSATTLSFTLYELAKNQEAQRLAQSEVDNYLSRHGNQLIYECVNEMPYLEACLDETLRVYPVLSLLTREVIEEYTFPSGLKLEKGARVHIPVYKLHHDPTHFPDPEVYRPERFLRENKNNIKPYTYLPFGEGPRTCIGMRFAKMQMMGGLITFLKKFHVELAEDMPSRVQFEPRAIVTQPAGDGQIRLKFKVRDGWEKRTLCKTKRE